MFDPMRERDLLCVWLSDNPLRPDSSEFDVKFMYPDNWA